MHYVKSWFYADGRTEAKYIGTEYDGAMPEVDIGSETGPDIWVDAFDTHSEALQAVDEIRKESSK